MTRLQIVESGAIHAALSLRVLHKSLPNEAGAQVLSHKKQNASINPDHVSVVPVCQRIKGIDEPIFAPGRRIFGSHCLQNPQGLGGQKGNDPPAALGTTVPSMGPVAGGPPQTTYPCFCESETLIPQSSSL